MINFNYLMNIKTKTCIFIFNDYDFLSKSIMIKEIKNRYKNEHIDILYFEISMLEEDVINELFENIFPSYVIIEDNNLIELGPLLN